eukprot:439555-Hanusia_phi.AAC.1
MLMIEREDEEMVVVEKMTMMMNEMHNSPSAQTRSEGCCRRMIFQSKRWSFQPQCHRDKKTCNGKYRSNTTRVLPSFSSSFPPFSSPLLSSPLLLSLAG